MGQLKWDVNAVHTSLDELEEITQKIKPVIRRIDRRASRLRKMKHLPQYLTQRLDNLISNNLATAGRSFSNIRSVRSALPEIERTNGRKRYPQLVEGKQYRVAMGGPFLTRVEQSYPGATYYHPMATNLHVGDIITYRGKSTAYNGTDDAVPKDTFEFEGKPGAFSPHNKGAANRAYLIPVDSPHGMKH